VAERVGNDHVVARSVERLSRAEELAGERGREHTGARAGGPVQNEDRLARRCADGPVVQLQLGHDFAGVEAEVASGPRAFLRRGVVRRPRRERAERARQDRYDARQSLQVIHW